jgi:hypothetical protein
MKALYPVLLLLAATLALLWADIFLLGDRQTLVPPPESIAEDFVHQLATRRFEQARDDLTDEEKEKVDADDLRAMADRLRASAGKVEESRGEPGQITGDRAAAQVTVRTDRSKQLHLPFKLVRSKGEWKIEHLPKI